MKKVFTLFLCLALLLPLTACGNEDASSGGQQSQTTEKTTQLEDGGKKVEKFENGVLYLAEVYLPDGTKAYQQRYFDGLLKETEYYLSDGALEYRHSYKHDDKDRVVEECYYYPDDGDSTYFIFYTYNDADRLVKKEEADQSQIPKKTWDYYEDGTYDLTDRQTIEDWFRTVTLTLVTRYNAEGRKLYADMPYQGYNYGHIDYNEDGSGVMYLYQNIIEEYKGAVQYERQFDKDGQIIKGIYYNYETKAPIETTTGIFDNSGKLIGRFRTDYQEGYTFYYEEEQTADGRTLEYRAYDNGLFLVEKFQYNQKDKQIRCDIYDGSNVLQEYILTEYDDDGKRKQDNCYYADGTLRAYIVYDKDGNGTEYYPN